MDEEEEPEFNAFEDELLDDVFVAYENTFVPTTSSTIKDIEVDDTAKLLAFVEFDGTISVWECIEGFWTKQTAWRYKFPRKYRQRPLKSGPYDALVSTLRPNVIARWSRGHDRYLAVASDVSRKAHIFGENTDPPPFDRTDLPTSWHRKHTMTSAAYITEMRFSPPHVEFTLITATINGMVIIHMLQDKNKITSWRPIHAISVFRNQPITSLSWNQNPVHELPILIASTDHVEAVEGKQIAVFAINSPSVRPEINMCFENTSHVSCVSFAPSSGLNDSLLAVAAGRKITLYLMNVEEFQVPDQFTPSLTSETDDYQQETESESLLSSINAPSSSLEMDKMSELSTPASVPSSMNAVHTTVSTISSDSPIVPTDFFRTDGSSLEDNYGAHYRRDESDSEGGSTEEEELEREPTEGRKALMWNVKWSAVFRERCAVKHIQWGKNSDNFTAQLIDGTIQGYKWQFGCVWSKSTNIQLRKLQPTQKDSDE